jgi:hypothetical protein
VLSPEGSPLSGQSLLRHQQPALRPLACAGPGNRSPRGGQRAFPGPGSDGASPTVLSIADGQLGQGEYLMAQLHQKSAILPFTRRAFRDMHLLLFSQAWNGGARLGII